MDEEEKQLRTIYKIKYGPEYTGLAWVDYEMYLIMRFGSIEQSYISYLQINKTATKEDYFKFIESYTEKLNNE